MNGRIFITGDKHRTFVPLFWLAEKETLHPSDVMIIAGDAGYVWDKDYIYDMESLQQVFPGTIAFVDGNHENHAMLNEFPVEKWNGGNVHRVGERVFHLMRGEIYDIYEKKFFVFGGARSVDKDRRTEGVSWWKEEEPTYSINLLTRLHMSSHMNRRFLPEALSAGKKAWMKTTSFH